MASKGKNPPKGPQDSALSFLVLNSISKAAAIADKSAADKIKPELANAILF